MQWDPTQLPSGPAQERDTQTGPQPGLVPGWAPEDPPLSDQTASLVWLWATVGEPGEGRPCGDGGTPRVFFADPDSVQLPSLDPSWVMTLNDVQDLLAECLCTSTSQRTFKNTAGADAPSHPR